MFRQVLLNPKRKGKWLGFMIKILRYLKSRKMKCSKAVLNDLW